MFESFFTRFAQVIPKVKADDEEMVDPQQSLRSKQKAKNTKQVENPIKNIISPVKKLENPAKKEGTPAKKDGTPAKKDDTPTKKDEECKCVNPKSPCTDGEESKEEDGNDIETLVDPIDEIREKCREEKRAVELAEKYDACNERVLSKSQTAETCIEELFDLLHVIDHCVTKNLFPKLK